MKKDSVYIIAELSANHNGSLDRALETVQAAADAGADAIKLQTYTADTLTIDCDNEYFTISGGTAWDGNTLYNLYKEAFTPWEWHADLQQKAASVGLDFFSSPFDHTAVDFLESLNVPYHKIASFELIDHPLLKKVASTKKPIIMSTGMASLKEIDEAVGVLRSEGCSELCLLKCTSSYPAQSEDANLKTIQDLKERFNCRVGLSDHTLGIAVPVAAVIFGATIIEKHFTLSRSDGGADSSFSLEPEEFRSMVEAVRVAEKSIGEITYGGSLSEEKSKAFRRSLFVVDDISEGEVFTSENIRSIRPGYGLAPKHYEDILGKRASRALSIGTPLSWEHVV